MREVTCTRPAASRSLCHASQPLHCASTRPLSHASGLTIRAVRAPADCNTESVLLHLMCDWCSAGGNQQEVQQKLTSTRREHGTMQQHQNQHSMRHPWNLSQQWYATCSPHLSQVKVTCMLRRGMSSCMVATDPTALALGGDTASASLLDVSLLLDASLLLASAHAQSCINPGRTTRAPR
jgi:hypothetical protein